MQTPCCSIWKAIRPKWIGREAKELLSLKEKGMPEYALAPITDFLSEATRCPVCGRGEEKTVIQPAPPEAPPTVPTVPPTALKCRKCKGSGRLGYDDSGILSVCMECRGKGTIRPVKKRTAEQEQRLMQARRRIEEAQKNQ